MLLIGLIIVSIALYGYWFLFLPLNYWKKRGIPYVKGVPIVGNMFWHSIRKTAFKDDLARIYNAYPTRKCYGMFMFNTPTIMVRDIELIKNIFIKNFVNHSKLVFQENGNPLLVKHLAALKGNRWREMRATLSPAFTGSKMRGMFQLINECGEQFVDYLMNEIKNLENNKLLDIELKDTFTRFATDVIASTAFGVKCDSLRDRNNEFYRMGLKVSNFETWRTVLSNFCPKIAQLLHIGFIPSNACDYLRNVVIETIKTRKRENIERPDLLQLLIDAEKCALELNDNTIEINKGFATVEESDQLQTNKRIYLDEEDTAAQAFVFLMGAFDSVSSTICFAIYELALHPDLQNHLYLENEKILKENNGKLTYDVLNKMKYLDMVITETLRKWPPAVSTFLDRVCDRPYNVEIDGKEITLETGTVFTIPASAIHYDPQYHPDPEKFNPDRFNDENKHKINSYAYMPFSIGPRNCIASRFALMEAKAAIFYTIKYFEIVVNEKSTIPPKLCTKSMNINLKNGFNVSLRERKH